MFQLRRRTPGERQAYLQGYTAALKHAETSLTKTGSVETVLKHLKDMMISVGLQLDNQTNNLGSD